jgi:hypothetical protein
MFSNNRENQGREKGEVDGVLDWEIVGSFIEYGFESRESLELLDCWF